MSPFSFQFNSEAIKRFRYSPCRSWKRMLSAYLAWFSIPVPVQHQKELSGVE